MDLIQLEYVRYRYPDASAQALDDINLNIRAGEYVLLAGASGSGKSTFCRLLNGLIPHFYGGSLDGSTRIEGVDTRARPVHEWFARVGLVFQNPQAQLFNSTVAREIAFGLESLGLPRGEIRERIEWTLRAVQIEPLRDRPPHSLSGGEQQLVAIAAMLALRPLVLVLDEPFANLDPAAIERVRMLLRDIHAQGTTLVLAEHRLHATLQDATRLIVLDQGRLARDGAPREVLRDNVARLRLNVPFVVRLAHASGWPAIPLSVDEAMDMARRDDHVLLPERRNGAHGVPGDSPAVVEARGLSFAREGRAILQDIQFELRRGECVALIGQNGSGKTTLLKHLDGLYCPTAGSLRVLGQDTVRTPVSDLAQHVGLVFQNPNDQLFKPNVREEIEVAPRALRRFETAWIEKLIAMFELAPLLDRSPFTLSEGEKKRVAFAATLAARPAIVALDEPTTGQDSAFRSALARLMHDLQGEGMTILLATHDLEFAESAASRWLVLADGRIIVHGLPDDVMANAEVMQRAALRSTARFRFVQAMAANAGEPSIGDVVESGRRKRPFGVSVQGLRPWRGEMRGVPPSIPSLPPPAPARREREGARRGWVSMPPAFDPRTKLIIAIGFAAVMVMTSNLAVLAIGIAMPALLAIALRRARAWFDLLQVLLPMTAFFVVLMLFSFDLVTVAGTALRLVAMTSAFFVFFQTTPPEDLGNALVKSRVPYAFAFILTTAMQFVPVLTRQMQNVMDAQRARGIRLERDLVSLPNYPALFAPFLIQSFTLADQLAEAMEARGFGAPHRTFASDYALRVQDYVVVLAALGSVILAWSFR